MEALMQVLAAKKREVLSVQEKKQHTKEKYLRRAEIESLLDQETAQKQQEMTLKKRKIELEASTKMGTNLDYTKTKRNNDPNTEKVLSWPDMRRRLRELGEPITLFNENLEDRMTRLRRLEMDAATRHDDELGAGHDIRNRFVGGMGTNDQKEEAADAAEDAEEFETSSDNHKKKNDGKTIEEAEEAEEESDADKMVYRFFKGMLQKWEKDLTCRPDHVKRTAQGKIAVQTMKQCKDYIRPLFKLCKQRQVPSDILPKLVDIVKFCRQGEFVMANDAYIKLAIGNAAWPIGVTMVGIHERTGREKINSNKQAHVMNNESQRKYLTSVKRLMSYAQSVSSVLPSKRVL
ncbi:hypothetical protein DD238_002484 [Peronospora effusa]|uniref:Pre-mRNA-splicing factor 18 n=1 Tax=Peronospora effusa TaxID=542832 RepID=A0A3M6VSA3_9STRA|nr:hypothetical protein DD238_002484 [Peronospora effusa]